MKEYIITWNAGYGESYELITAEDLEAAESAAHDCWKEEAESHCEYMAMEATEENKEEYGL